jgi:hypothetical protein
MDFAQKRRAEGRAATASMEELMSLLKPVADQMGVDLQGRLAEAGLQIEVRKRELAERLQRSVLPLFIYHQRYPGTLGSCVLVRLDSTCYAFTAAHVLRDAGSAPLWFPPEGRGEMFLRLPRSTSLTLLVDRDSLDVGVLMIPTSTLGAFEQRVFLTGSEIDEDSRPDETEVASFYFVLGYSGSRTQMKVSPDTGRINQKSFQLHTSIVSNAEYSQQNLKPSEHLLLDFDHKEIAIKGHRVDPPKLQGVSGGGVFHLSRVTQKGPLVAIATENRRSSRLIVGTRIIHFIDTARELSATAPSRLRQ